MPTYGFTIEKETHSRYIKLTHLYGVSPYWFSEQMRNKLNELIDELWEKRKEKHADETTHVIRDVTQSMEEQQEPAAEEDLNIFRPIVDGDENG